MFLISMFDSILESPSFHNVVQLPKTMFWLASEGAVAWLEHQCAFGPLRTSLIHVSSIFLFCTPKILSSFLQFKLIATRPPSEALCTDHCNVLAFLVSAITVLPRIALLQ
eukprot:SAG31_NODE_1509_length_8062_cov_6.974884_8_plen_110_part_00